MTEIILESTAGALAKAEEAAQRLSHNRARGMVCFTWDDNYTSHNVIRSAAAALGQRHTFAVCTQNIGQAGRMTSADVLAAYGQGHEIASHSVQHLTALAISQAARTIEFDNSKTAIEAIIGAGNCRTYIYPVGDSSARDVTIDRELYLRYDRFISTASGSRTFHRTDDRELQPIGRMNWDGTAAVHQRVLAAIRYAATHPVIAMVYSHDLDTAGSCTTAQMTEAITLASTLGVPCVTAAEAFPAAGALSDPGFEDSTLASWTGIDSPLGTQTIESIVDTPAENYAGTRSLHLASSSATAFAYVTQSIPVLPGRKYVLSGRYRVANLGAGTGKVYAKVNERTAVDSVGSIVTSNVTAALTSTTWAQFTLTFTANADTSMVDVALLVENIIGDAYFDHLHWGENRNGVLG